MHRSSYFANWRAQLLCADVLAVNTTARAGHVIMSQSTKPLFFLRNISLLFLYGLLFIYLFIAIEAIWQPKL